MNKDSIDLDVLENADNETVERLAGEYEAVTEKDIQRLYARSEKIYSNRTNEDSEMVTGVDVYRKPVWHRILAAASALLLVAGVAVGGMLALRKMKTSPDNIMTDTTEATELFPKISNAPFGNISGERVRFMAAAYAPYLLEADADDVEQLAEVFDSADWTEISADTPVPDGETAIVYVYNDGQPFRLVFYGDYTVDYETDEKLTKYAVSEQAFSTAFEMANNLAFPEKLIWCEPENVTLKGVWETDGIVHEEKMYRELQMHELIAVDTMEEAQELFDSHAEKMNVRERYGIDAERYSQQIIDSEDKNTLENKSFIYHMMLNSVDYYNTASGTMVYDDIEAEFQTDINAGESYLKYTFSDGSVRENYYADGYRYELFTGDDGSPQYTQEVFGNAEDDMYINDNYRRIIINSPDHGIANYRRDITNTESIVNTAIFPQALAMLQLSDFETWHIDDVTDAYGCKCAIISGNEFTMYVDIKTGILMYYSKGSNVVEIKNIEIDKGCERKTPDLTGRKRMIMKNDPNKGFGLCPYDNSADNLSYYNIPPSEQKESVTVPVNRDGGIAVFIDEQK